MQQHFRMQTPIFRDAHSQSHKKPLHLGSSNAMSGFNITNPFLKKSITLMKSHKPNLYEEDRNEDINNLLKDIESQKDSKAGRRELQKKTLDDLERMAKEALYNI